MSQFDGKLDQSNPSGNIAFKIYFDKFNDLSLARITLLGLWPTKCTQESLRFCDRKNIRKVHISKKKTLILSPKSSNNRPAQENRSKYSQITVYG